MYVVELISKMIDFANEHDIANSRIKIDNPPYSDLSITMGILDGMITVTGIKGRPSDQDGETDGEYDLANDITKIVVLVCMKNTSDRDEASEFQFTTLVSKNLGFNWTNFNNAIVRIWENSVDFWKM